MASVGTKGGGMNQEERDAMQALLSASIRVVRTPMTGVPIDSPMARAVFNLAVQLAAAGFILVDEAQQAAAALSIEAVCDEANGKGAA